MENQQSLKILTFAVSKLTLALPVNNVKKIVNLTNLTGSGLGHISITHLQDKEITVIDLHKKLFKTEAVDLNRAKGYLIITSNEQAEMFGIIVNQTPILLEIPLEQVRVIPDSYRRSDTLDIASHVTVIEQADDMPKTVFIIDVNHLLVASN